MLNAHFSNDQQAHLNSRGEQKKKAGVGIDTEFFNFRLLISTPSFANTFDETFKVNNYSEKKSEMWEQRKTFRTCFRVNVGPKNAGVAHFKP